MIRELHNYQTFDPARGSFMVHPIQVKKSNGVRKTKMCSDGQVRDVFRAAHHVEKSRHGVSHVPHPDAFDFVWMD